MSLFEEALGITLKAFAKADGSALDANEVAALADHLRDTATRCGGFSSAAASRLKKYSSPASKTVRTLPAAAPAGSPSSGG